MVEKRKDKEAKPAAASLVTFIILNVVMTVVTLGLQVIFCWVQTFHLVCIR